MHPENLRIRRDRTEQTGDSNACEKENLDRVSAGTQGKTPCQSRSEKAVVQALIRGQGLRCRNKLRCKAESPQATRLVPEEHLQNEKINMQESDQGDSDIRDCRHLWLQGLGLIHVPLIHELAGNCCGFLTIEHR